MLVQTDVRLADVAVVSCSSDRCRSLASRVIARVAPGSGVKKMARADLAMLVRRAIPSLDIIKRLEGYLEIVASTDQSGSARDRCLQLKVDRSVGDAIVEGDVLPVDCPEHGALRAVRYSHAAKRNFASADLPAGAIIAGVQLVERTTIARGDQLMLVSQAGPARIERPVIAAQSSEPEDRRIFVRDGDRQVFAVPLAKEMHR